ncbi:MAG: glycoside hydrolase family 76 protein [Candidatus Omnitrophica bacterium]|nr:glycoside hydrolase family 76 protein [Candidatus Omnitrophota bacterium]
MSRDMTKSGKKIAIVLIAVAAMFIVVRSCHRRPAEVRGPAGRQALHGASGIARAANPLDHPRQRDSAINAGELVSFILEWTNPETGLVPTIISKSGHKNPFSDMSYAYVQAVVHQNLVLAGLTDRSSKTAELFRSRGETREIPNGFSVRTGLSEDPLITAGPNAYWGISFVKEYQLTGDEKWITAAGRRADFLLKLQTGDGGIRKSPFHGNPEYNAKSTEENLDCYALFSMLSRITKENKYKAAASDVLKWLAESGVYNKEAGYFTAGTSNDEVNPVYATDANALAIVILGPELLDSGGEMQFGGAGTSRRILDSLDEAKVKVDYLHPSGVVVKGLEGFDYTDKFGRPGRKPVLSPEFTSQAVLAYLVMAKYANEKGDAEYSAKLIEEAGRYLYGLGRMAARTGRSASLPYASEKGIRRFSFDNWLTPQAESDMSAMWASFPLAGYNPFSLEGFELRDALSGTAKWMGEPGEVIKPAKAVVIPETEKIISEAELIAQQEAAREESMRKPIVYYKALYDQVYKDAGIARKRVIAVLMTSYNGWFNGVLDTQSRDYDVIGVDRDYRILYKKFQDLPDKTRKAVQSEYAYVDDSTGIKWRIAPKYNLDLDGEYKPYYAFEIDGDYNIVKQFSSESDVPEANRDDLKDPKAQFQSSRELAEGHLIARYLNALEVDDEMNITRYYDSVEDLPGLVSKVPISEDEYRRYTRAKDWERRDLISAGIIPDEKGMLATQERGIYYAKVLGLDETRRLRVGGVSVASGREIVMGTRFSLTNWRVGEASKANAVKYEIGLIKGMVIKPREQFTGGNFSPTQPLWIYLGEDVLAAETKEFTKRLLDLLKRIKSEKDAQTRLELIEQYDRLSGELAWYDDNGLIHVIYYGAKAAESRLGDFETAKVRAESSLKKYESILGRDELGRDLRDLYGRVWLKVINEATGRVLYVEVYDMSGNLETIYSENIKIDPLTKAVTSDVRTDLQYDKETLQVVGSHTYRTDENGDWVSDISESIFKGYTPDKKYFISEVHIFARDENGRVLFEDGKARYTKKLEYYTPEGDISAQIVKNIVTIVKYGPDREVVKEVFLDTPGKAVSAENTNLEELTKGLAWVRRYKTTSSIMNFKEALTQSLTSLPEQDREMSAVQILNRLGAEKVGRVSDMLMLEENLVTNNLTGDPGAPGEAPYFVFYEPGDSLGRQRMIVRGGTIEVPVDWIAESDIPSKTLTFNLAGELVSISDVDNAVRADSALPPKYLKKMAPLGIYADTLLPQMKKRIFRMVTGEDGLPHFTNTVAITTVSYMIPDDVLGRELVTVKFVMLGDETTLHKGSTLKLKRNFFGGETVLESWKDDRDEEHTRAIAKKEDTVIYEWYKEGLSADELRAHLKADYGKLIRRKALDEALKSAAVAPFGTLPGYLMIKPNGSIGEIKYFSGTVEYQRSMFSHPGVKIPYETEVVPFKLPDGLPIRGVKYGVLNSDYAFYDVHSLSGQLIVLERRFIILRLMNILPIQGGRQTEFYDPLVPYSYLRPIKIEREFAPGMQPEGTLPGRQIVAVFVGDASIYHRNGWQTQTFLERRPFDIEHWIRSDYEFDDNGVYKFKKEHIESSSIYLMKSTNWRKPLTLLIFAAGLFLLAGYVSRRRLKVGRKARIAFAAEEARKQAIPAGAIKPFSREALGRLKAPEELKAACIRVYEGSEPPAALYDMSAKVFRPLLEERLRGFGADPSDHTASINVLLDRIACRIGREDIRLSDLFPVEAKEFEAWSRKNGHGISLTAAKPGMDELTVVVLFKLIFDESMEFRAAATGFRNYLLDKSLSMLDSGQKDAVIKEIRSDTWVLLEALRPGYDKKLGLTKEFIFTYDDLNDLFEGKRPGFIASFAKLSGRSGEEKLSYLASREGKDSSADIKSHKNFAWLKTFPDNAGTPQFIDNLKRFWQFLVPMFTAVMLGGIAIALKRVPFSGRLTGMAGTVGAAFIEVTVLILVGVAITMALIKGTLGNYKPAAFAAPERRDLRRSIRVFWIMFGSASYLWGLFSIFVIIWTVRIIAKLTFVNFGWGFFINASALLLTMTFILSSFFSLFYIIIALIGFYRGKREGVGQVITWDQLRRKFEASKLRFGEVMMPLRPAKVGGGSDAPWKTYWNSMITELYDYYVISGKERDALLYSDKNPSLKLEKPPRAEEASERIRLYVNSWLMEMPKAESWTDLPSFTAMITAFNEPVSFSFDELNGCDRGAEVTRLNHLIGFYRPQWEEFVGRLRDAEMGQFVTKEQLKLLFGLKKLPDGLPEQLKEDIRRWANLTVQCVEKTAVEVYRIRDAFAAYARICYPEASDAVIAELIANKVQILLNYEGYHSGATRDSDREALNRLMKEMPALEVYWGAADADVEGSDRGLHRFNVSSGNIELIEVAPFIAPIKKGKPSGLNQALPFVKGETILFFDANCSVRIEDAAKLPVALSEFRNDPGLGEVLFAEYIFNKNYSWISQAIGFNEETFVSVTQRTMNMFQACGFYGHSAIIRTDMISASCGLPQDYISEDILLATALWKKGFRTTHKEYITFGKGRETSYFTSLVPLTKWAMGSSDAAIGRVIRGILDSENIHVAQKFMLMFGFSFFYQTPLMFVINFLYLWLMICWGINGFMAVPYPIVFGILGLLFNQAITATGIAYLIEHYGFRRSFPAYMRLVAKNHFFYASVIPAYAFGFLAGLKGKAVFIISAKGWNLGHLPLKMIWGEKRDILKATLFSTIIGLPLAYVLVSSETVPLWISPFIPFLPFAVVALMYTMGVRWKELGRPYLKNWRDEIVPDGDIGKMSVIKLQMIYAMVLLVFTGVGFVMWGLIFSSLAVKALFVFSVLYISTTLSFIIMPLFAHSQPIALFKEITLSRFWNYAVIPMLAASVMLGIVSIVSGPATASPESLVYTLLGILMLIGWALLKWKLSGYARLDKWFKQNLPSYNKVSPAQKADFLDDVYFAHQELIQGDRLAELKYNRTLVRAKAVYISTLVITLLLYFISEFDHRFYSNWIWVIAAIESVYMLILNVEHTSDDRVYLGKLCNEVMIHDFNRLNENVRAMEDIWNKLDRGYKSKLVRVYEDEFRAKKAMINYMSRCIKAWTSVR